VNARKPHTKWTADKTAVLQSLAHEGRLTVTLETAAERLDVSPPTVCIHLKRLGILPADPIRFWTPERLQLLRSMLNDNGDLGIPRRVAAARLGCNPTTIVTGLSYLPSRHARFHWTADKRRRLQTYVNASNELTDTVEAIAAILGCRKRALTAAIKEGGIRPRGTVVEG
jgi:hypothetical protein